MMRKTVYALIAVLIILLSIVGYIVFSQSSDPWVDPDEPVPLGEINQYIIVNFTDGTTERIEKTNMGLLFFLYNGKKVMEMGYYLEAKAEDDTIDVRLDEFKATFEIFNMNKVKVKTFIIESDVVNDVKTVGAGWTPIFKQYFSPVGILGSLGPSMYTISVHTDNILYNYDGSWKETSNPSDLDFDMEVTTGGEVTIVIRGGSSSNE